VTEHKNRLQTHAASRSLTQSDQFKLIQTMKITFVFTHHVYALKIKDLGPLTRKQKTIYRRVFLREFGAKNGELFGWLFSFKRSGLNTKKGEKNAWESFQISEA